ncbi:hypothetical protein SAMN04489724_3231 [Algoriphagus locisalis]|uniref:6-bladed beta-propeller protein n=1 Tax=Algoriphagus locisalis TaxID=305507 RepID=A0A1I7CIE7_9BACT|nr:hypothetical protein [Algoriphagus locisalis]SFT99201.1 hypothetical protein SAMN04489724_3231 [Algoriphagus locisalis]
MKNLAYLSLLIFAFTALACSGEKEEAKSSTPLSEQTLAFEIYDSLVVDYLGNLMLMDISPDGSTFLLTDTNTDSLFVTNSEGEILHQYLLKGEGPNNYAGSRTGFAKFIGESEFLIPTQRGVYKYNFEGELLKNYNPDFTTSVNLIIGNSNNSVIHDNKFYTNLTGRNFDKYGRQGIEFQQNSKQLEELDLETGSYSPLIPFPKASKFSSTEKSYPVLNFYLNLSATEDSLFINFRNEPKIYGYAFEQLDSASTPSSVRTIPFTSFVEKEPKENLQDGSFDFRDFFLGTVNSIIAIEENMFLVDYVEGLSDEDYSEASASAGGDPNKIFEEGSKFNTMGLVLFDGTQLSELIAKPEILGNLSKYVSKDEIWFSLNFSAAENDYSVIYKTRLVEK